MKTGKKSHQFLSPALNLYKQENLCCGSWAFALFSVCGILVDFL